MLCSPNSQDRCVRVSPVIVLFVACCIAIHSIEIGMWSFAKRARLVVSTHVIANLSPWIGRVPTTYVEERTFSPFQRARSRYWIHLSIWLGSLWNVSVPCACFMILWVVYVLILDSLSRLTLDGGAVLLNYSLEMLKQVHKWWLHKKITFMMCW